MLRRLIIFPFLPLFCVGGYAGEERRPILGSDLRVEAIAVPLDRSDPERRRVGKLTFLEGWELRGKDSAFGSFSAMIANGRTFLFLNDAGGLVRLHIDPAGEVRNVRFGDLKEGPGSSWSKRNRDTEAMTRDPASGRLWISFERHNMIWRYGPQLRAEAHVKPALMRAWPNNAGAEAMVRLRSGGFLVFSEKGPGRNGAPAVLAFDRDPTDRKARSFSFYHTPPRGYRVTDAAELPDGRLLLLYRRILLPLSFAAKLATIDPGAIKFGATVRSTDVATLASPMTVDNMEALAVSEEGGRTILWIASDDNFTPLLQRTLLLKFRLER